MAAGVAVARATGRRVYPDYDDFRPRPVVELRACAERIYRAHVAWMEPAQRRAMVTVAVLVLDIAAQPGGQPINMVAVAAAAAQRVGCEVAEPMVQRVVAELDSLGLVRGRPPGSGLVLYEELPRPHIGSRDRWRAPEGWAAP